MNVYLLQTGDWDQRYIAGAYATVEAAKAAHDTDHEAQWQETSPGIWGCAWNTPAIPPKNEPITFKTLSIPVVNGVAVLPDGREVQVQSDYPFVAVPVLPDGYKPDLGQPARWCLDEIVRMDVRE